MTDEVVGCVVKYHGSLAEHHGIYVVTDVGSDGRYVLSGLLNTKRLRCVGRDSFTTTATLPEWLEAAR